MRALCVFIREIGKPLGLDIGHALEFDLESSRSPTAATGTGEKSSFKPLEPIENTPPAGCDKICDRTLINKVKGVKRGSF